MGFPGGGAEGAAQGSPLGWGWRAEPLTGECHFPSLSQRLRVVSGEVLARAPPPRPPLLGCQGEGSPRGLVLGGISAVTPSPQAPSQGCR